MSLLHRQGEKLGVGRGQSGGGADVELLEDLEENLKHLIVGILVSHMDDIPLRMQRHVMGVGDPFGRLLWKVARAVIFHNYYRAPCND